MTAIEQAIKDAVEKGGYNYAGIGTGQSHKWMGDRVRWHNNL